MVLRDKHPTRVGSIFLRRADGTLTERWWDASVGGWRWMHHGSPDTTFVASAPGALHESRELYVVGGDGNLWSRAFIEDGWKWIDRGAPSAPLSVVAPIKVGGSDVMVGGTFFFFFFIFFFCSFLLFFFFFWYITIGNPDVLEIFMMMTSLFFFFSRW